MHIGAALNQYSLANGLANGGSLPDCSSANPEFAGGAWPWDISTNLVNELDRRGAGRASLCCPANPALNTLEHWEFWRFTHTSIRVISYGMLFYGQGQEPRNYPIRVVGYVFLLNGCVEVPQELWWRNILGDGTKSAAQTELVIDGVGSQQGNFMHIQGVNVDRTSHVQGTRPVGGNIAFEDGHSEWRNFKQMSPQIYSQVLWYF
jgi:hypothetical protein